jgi:hypothetical protein
MMSCCCWMALLCSAVEGNGECGRRVAVRRERTGGTVPVGVKL